MESSRFKFEKANECLSQLRSVVATLEHYRNVSDGRRARLLGLAIDAVAIVEQDIYENELSGVARLRK